MTLGWQVLPEFRIVQHEDNVEALNKIRNYFGFGSIKNNRKDKHGVRKEFKVRGLKNLNKIVKFFKENKLQTPSKVKNFEIFAEIIEKINQREHLTKNGLDNISKLISQMNKQPKLRHLESSETIRQNSDFSE